MPANARGRRPAARAASPRASAPLKTRPQSATTSHPPSDTARGAPTRPSAGKSGGTPAGPSAKTEQEPATAGPSSAPAKEPPPDTELAKAIRVAGEALQKEDDFRKEVEETKEEYATFQKKYRLSHRRMPAELKERTATYTDKALKKLTNARIAADGAWIALERKATAAGRTPKKK